MGDPRHGHEAIAVERPKDTKSDENVNTGNVRETGVPKVKDLASTAESSNLHTRDPVPPPLPPRPTITQNQDGQSLDYYPSLLHTSGAIEPTSASKATTALSTTDVLTHHLVDDGLRGALSSPVSRSDIKSSPRESISRGKHSDSASLRSYAPTLETSGDVESLLGEILNEEDSTTWNGISGQLTRDGPFPEYEAAEGVVGHDYENEFEEIRTTGDCDEGQSRHSTHL